MQSNSTPARSSTDSSNPKADMGAAFMVSLSQTMMIYQCPYCPRTFHSSQALGGHQNAHRRDRIVARERFVQERLAFMGKLNSLTPSPLAIPQPNPNFEQFIPPPVVARLGPAYDPGVGLFQPGLGYRPTNTLGFQPGLASPGYGPQNEPGFEMWHNPACPPGAGYNFPNGESRQGNYYYHPYQRSTETNSASKMKMADVPWETAMEASSDTAESHTNGAKDENGGDKDRNEITSKKRIVIDLTLSP